MLRRYEKRKAKMTDEIRVSVGGSLKDDLAAFRSAWERAERGEAVQPERALAFESWERLASVMTGERYRLLRHLHAQPEPSVSALARHLGRHLRRVQEDVGGTRAGRIGGPVAGDGAVGGGSDFGRSPTVVGKEMSVPMIDEHPARSCSAPNSPKLPTRRGGRGSAFACKPGKPTARGRQISDGSPGIGTFPEQ